MFHGEQDDSSLMARFHTDIFRAFITNVINLSKVYFSFNFFLSEERPLEGRFFFDDVRTFPTCWNSWNYMAAHGRTASPTCAGGSSTVVRACYCLAGTSDRSKRELLEKLTMAPHCDWMQTSTGKSGSLGRKTSEKERAPLLSHDLKGNCFTEKFFIRESTFWKDTQCNTASGEAFGDPFSKELTEGYIRFMK